jgi:hypothetical protein
MSLRAAGALALFAAFLTLGGCATVDSPYREHLESRTDRIRECAEWYRQMDERIGAAGVRDAQDARVAGFPYLRVNRLLSALRPRAAADALALEALAERMLLLDLDARRFELRNLPLAPDEDSNHPFGLRIAMERTAACGRLLQEADLARPESRAALLARAEVPDDYLLAHRILGLYALTRIPFAAGVRRYEAEVRAAFARDLTPPAGAALLRYDPPGLPRSMPRSRALAILAVTSDNPLGIPEPTEADLAELLLAHAPSLEIEVATDADRFGALRWLRGRPAPGIEGAELAVYAHPAWTRYGNKTLLQLVYTFWFPERPPQAQGDLLAGRIDGVTWRVTLAPDGEPLLYDTIHPCGCFHLFFPTPRAAPRPAPDSPDEWAFAPQSLPRIAEGERPLLRIAAHTHYVERVSLVRRAEGLVRYGIRPYAELRSLQTMEGGRRSVFGEDGLMPGTERPERLLFWPMGIRSAGAMRQWGRQATAFVGRRHFDDADLLEKRFVLDLERPQ